MNNTFFRFESKNFAEIAEKFRKLQNYPYYYKKQSDTYKKCTHIYLFMIEKNPGKAYHDKHITGRGIDAAAEKVVIKDDFSLNLLVAGSQEPLGNLVAV
jgi:hypothetical protein